MFRKFKLCDCGCLFKVDSVWDTHVSLLQVLSFLIVISCSCTQLQACIRGLQRTVSIFHEAEAFIRSQQLTNAEAAFMLQDALKKSFADSTNSGHHYAGTPSDATSVFDSDIIEKLMVGSDNDHIKNCIMRHC